MRIKGRLDKLEKQTIPTFDELTAVLLQVTGEPPKDVYAAMLRLVNDSGKPGDQEFANSWIRPYCEQIWAAWDRAYPRWAECSIWAEKRAERAANEQV